MSVYVCTQDLCLFIHVLCPVQDLFRQMQQMPGIREECMRKEMLPPPPPSQPPHSPTSRNPDSVYPGGYFQCVQGEEYSNYPQMEYAQVPHTQMQQLPGQAQHVPAQQVFPQEQYQQYISET
eukprot:GHVR01093435.1.p1 GENE.GHVR01093435.1~~GHVR01093435.1.p1  ORF type:complete len:122 (-),score=20.19 GHVR01093435.1:429-794(-)